MCWGGAATAHKARPSMIMNVAVMTSDCKVLYSTRSLPPPPPAPCMTRPCMARPYIYTIAVMASSDQAEDEISVVRRMSSTDDPTMTPNEPGTTCQPCAFTSQIEKLRSSSSKLTVLDSPGPSATLLKP